MTRKDYKVIASAIAKTIAQNMIADIPIIQVIMRSDVIAEFKKYDNLLGNLDDELFLDNDLFDRLRFEKYILEETIDQIKVMRSL